MALDDYVAQSDLEATYSVERVAEFACVQASDGSTTGVANAAVVTKAIKRACAKANRILFGIHGPDMPFTAPYPDTLTQLIEPLAMFELSLRRPEFVAEPEKSPFFKVAESACKDLHELRESVQRLSATMDPANTGGQLAQQTVDGVRPFTFLADPTSSDACGGFNSGDF